MFKARGGLPHERGGNAGRKFWFKPLKKFWLHESSITKKKKEMKKKINFFTSIP